MQKRHPLEIVKSVIFALVLREMRGRFGRLRMGALWVVLEPVAHLAAVGTLVTLRTQASPSYEFLVWLLVGLSPFLLYKNIVLKLMGSVDANKALFSYKQIQPADAFIARTLVEFCISAIVFFLIYVGLTWYGLDTRIADPLMWLFILLVGIALSMSLGTIYAIIANAIPEAAFILRLTFLPLYILSGVVFSLHRIPDEYMQYILWNPYLHIIDLIRSKTFFRYNVYPGVSLRYVMEFTAIALFFAAAAYRLRRFRLMAL